MCLHSFPFASNFIYCPCLHFYVYVCELYFTPAAYFRYATNYSKAYRFVFKSVDVYLPLILLQSVDRCVSKLKICISSSDLYSLSLFLVFVFCFSRSIMFVLFYHCRCECESMQYPQTQISDR